MFRQSFLVVLGLAAGSVIVGSFAGCGDPDPIALVPLPPGVAYPWRTQTGAPTPGEFAAIRRARLVVWNGALGADYYADNWQPLPVFPPDLPPTPSANFAAEEPSVEAPVRTEPTPRRDERRGLSEAPDERSESEPRLADSPRPPPGSSRLPSASPGRININSASAAQLEGLSGIGPALAARIVEARPYEDVDDLLRVSGIGPRTLARFEQSIVAD